jgi:hypothetical protein
VQPPDEEAVDADQLARPAGVDVRLGRRLARRLAVLAELAQGRLRQKLPALR